MKTALLMLFLILPAFAREKRPVGVCGGADPCKVCRDCSQCWHCSPKNPHRGSCGVMRDQDGKAQRARDARREANGK